MPHIAVNKKLNGHPSNGHSASAVEGVSPEDLDDLGVSEPEPAPREVPPPPTKIAELADACVRYVERSLGVRLDYSAETLPLLDHYLADAEKTLVAQSEKDAEAVKTTLSLLVPTAGAYFGEVIRRRYASWWRLDGEDPMTYRVEFETVFLAVSPMLIVYEQLARGLSMRGDESAFEASLIEMDEEDQRAAAERLAELEVDADEYYAPSTRLETIDVCVDTVRTRRLEAGDPVEMALSPEDYET